MKLRQGEMKKTMKGILAGAFLLAVGSAAVFAVGTETELKAYAAEWQQAENGDWTYKEDDGSLASGWQKYTVVVQEDSRPDEIGSTLKTFEVDRRTGTAKDVSTKIVLDLYE